MELSMLVSSKKIHPLELTAEEANNELLHFCQCLKIPTTISKENYYKSVTPLIEKKYAAKEDLSDHLDYRRMYFWHYFSLFILDIGRKRICDYGQDFHGYAEFERMKIIKASNRRYKQIVESCYGKLKLLGLTFYTFEEFKLETSTGGNVLIQEPTSEEFNLSVEDRKIVQDNCELTLSSDSNESLKDVEPMCNVVDNNLPINETASYHGVCQVQENVELTLSSDGSDEVINEAPSNNILPFLNHNDEPLSPEIEIIKKSTEIGCQTHPQLSEIGIGSGYVTRCEIGIGSGYVTSSEIGIGPGYVTSCEIGIGSGYVTSSEIGIGTGYVSVDESCVIGDKCQSVTIPPQIPQNEILGQHSEPDIQSIELGSSSIQVDVPQFDMLEDYTPMEELLIDIYIADSKNHQAISHKGNLYKYVLVQRDNLKVLTYNERTELINRFITLNVKDNRNNFYSCNFHHGTCNFVDVTTRYKSTVVNHVHSYLIYIICILCKKKFLHRPGFSQHIQYKHKSM